MHGFTVRLTFGSFVRLTDSSDPLSFALTKVLEKGIAATTRSLPKTLSVPSKVEHDKASRWQC